MAPKKKVASAPLDDEAKVLQKSSAADENEAAGRPPKKKRSRSSGGADDAADAIAAVGRQASSASGRGAAVTEGSVLEDTVPFQRLTKDSDFDPKIHYKIISWNVAGLRAMLRKEGELERLFSLHQPDVVCLQETKLSCDDKPDALQRIGVIPGYDFVDNVSTAKKGYSGTRTYFRTSAPHMDLFDFTVADPSKRDAEGRVITSLWHGLAIVNSYVPNSGMMLERLEHRNSQFDPMMRTYLHSLADAGQKKTLSLGSSEAFQGVIWTGDLNVAERDYDRFFASNYKQMQKSPGFTPEERTSFRKTLQECDLADAFRHLYPNASKVYSFWSARFDQRAKNNGWRLDYFVVSKNLLSRVVECCMLPQHKGSDHCPIMMWLRR